MYITETDDEERNQILNILNEIDIMSVYHYEDYFEDITKPQIKIAINIATEEQIIDFLINYVIEKEERENGSFMLISKAKSELMMYLYANYNNRNQDVNLLYNDLETMYLQNKNYFMKWKIAMQDIDDYKEKCKKL